MWKACCLVKSGELDAEAFAEAVWRHYDSRPPLGKVAVKLGLLDMGQLTSVLNEQDESGLQFGEAAVRLGYMDREQLASVLLWQEGMATPVETILVDMGKITYVQGVGGVMRDTLAV